MRAVRFHGAKDIRVEDVAEPSTRLLPDDVLIAPAVTGICGTDLHIEAAEFARAPPVTMGHEACGVVREVGDQVDPAWIGRRVLLNAAVPIAEPSSVSSVRRVARSGATGAISSSAATLAMP